MPMQIRFQKNFYQVKNYISNYFKICKLVHIFSIEQTFSLLWTQKPHTCATLIRVSERANVPNSTVTSERKETPDDWRQRSQCSVSKEVHTYDTKIAIEIQ